VTVRDSAGVSRAAPVYYVSPGQINFVVPDGVAAGVAAVTVSHAGAPDVTTTETVAAVAPALFTADASGSGTAAAIPILVNGVPQYLSLYGTGIRNRSSLAGVTCTIGGLSVPVLYAGPQPSFAGLDQVNVQLPPSIRGAGAKDVVLTVDGQAANTVQVSIQ
jgi:uncharacterized protein (TIGR03437 family)